MAHHCKYCSYTTNKKGNLCRHIRLKHSVTKEVFKCDHCDCTFTTLSNKQRHISEYCLEVKNVSSEVKNVSSEVKNVSSEVKNVSSEVKNVSFDAKNVSLNNPPDQTAAKICDRCGKSYYRVSYLKKHQLECTGEQNPLECDKCRKVFTTRSAKCRHVKICGALITAPTHTETAAATSSTPVASTISQQSGNVINNQAINTQTNNINNINIITFSKEKRDRLPFINDHITNDLVNKFVQLSLHNNPLEFEKDLTSRYCLAILDRPENRCVKKTNLRSNYSKVHIGNNKWHHKTDAQVFPKLVADLSECLYEYICSNRSKLNISTCLYKALDIFVNYMAENGLCNADKETRQEIYRSYHEILNILKAHVCNYTTDDQAPDLNTTPVT